MPNPHIVSLKKTGTNSGIDFFLFSDNMPFRISSAGKHGKLVPAGYPMATHAFPERKIFE